jgi:hypothetical protein
MGGALLFRGRSRGELQDASLEIALRAVGKVYFSYEL